MEKKESLLKGPAVSLLMPTRNRAKDLGQGLRNALGQTGVELELIVSDNCSTDRTEAILREVALADARVRFFRQEKMLGLYEHHNFCLEQAQGEFLAFFHDHDFHSPNFVQRCVELLKTHPGVGLVGADWRMENQCGEALGVRRAPVPKIEAGWNYIQRTIRSGRSSVAIPGAVMRRAAVANHRLGGAKGFGDFPLWFRIAENWRIGHIREVLWTMRQSADAQSATTVTQMTEDYLENIGAYLRDLEHRRPDLQNWIKDRRKEARRFVYWCLVYEWLLQARPRTANRKSQTLFEMYGYRLTQEQKKELKEKLASFSPACLTTFTSRLVSAGEGSGWTPFLFWCMNFPNIFRKILNLR